MDEDDRQTREELVAEVDALRARLIAALETSTQQTEKCVAELESANRRYDLAVQATTDGVWDWEIATNEEYFAPRWCEILGYSADDPELVHSYESWASRIHSEDRDRVEAAVRDHLTNRTPYDETYRHRHRSGEYRWQNSRGQAVWDEDGVPIRMVGVIRDIHELKQEEDRRVRADEERRKLGEQLQQAQKIEMVGTLAGGVAHDFNNLLTVVLGNACLALIELPRDSPLRSTIHAIEDAAFHGAALVRQMLAYAGKGQVSSEPVDVSKLIEGLDLLLAASVPDKVVIDYNLHKGLPPIMADPSQVSQVVINLVTNASEAIGDADGAITVSTGILTHGIDGSGSGLQAEIPSGAYVYIEVSDTGLGMDEATQAKMWDPFFSTKFAGRGLGLAAVQGIVRSYGGATKVVSQPGRGTQIQALFTVTE